jgi:hypothetical protein
MSLGDWAPLCQLLLTHTAKETALSLPAIRLFGSLALDFGPSLNPHLTEQFLHNLQSLLHPRTDPALLRECALTISSISPNLLPPHLPTILKILALLDD